MEKKPTKKEERKCQLETNAKVKVCYSKKGHSPVWRELVKQELRSQTNRGCSVAGCSVMTSLQ